MTKVKIVQMMVASSEECADWQYLDDKGRVWADYGRSVVDEDKPAPANSKFYKWVSNWQQVDLPDEPEQTS